MRRFLIITLCLASVCSVARAQFSSFSDIPVEITSDGETRFEGGVAIAENNVQIHYGDISIYSDYAEYNPDTRDVLLVGNIRLYSPEGMLTGQRSLFNLETRQMRSLEMQGEYFPLRFRAFALRAPSLREFRVRDAVMTTDDNSEPDFFVKSKSVRIYPNDRVVFLNSTLYVKKLPIFWFPYIFANLDSTGFEFLPGYDSNWGAFLLTAYSFPIGSGNNLTAKVKVDYRTQRGIALGFDAENQFGKDNRNYGNLETYYAWDQDPSESANGAVRPAALVPSEERYRVSYKQRLFLTDDIYATAYINLLSDRYMLEDFFPDKFSIDPQPDTYVAVTKWDEFYTMNLLARWQINDFQQTTERAPEFSLDFKQHRLFGLPIYYDGENTFGSYKRAFEDTSIFPDYSSARFDTFHQFSAPVMLFNWLSIVPRAGMRLTYYSKTGSFRQVVNDPLNPDVPISDESSPLNTPTPDLNEGGATFRPVFNTGFETSFKLSKTYERIQSRMLGLDGVRHVMQPYANYSLVYNAGDSPDQVLQFDRVVPSTQLLPITFPQFTAVDTIDTWNILRLGVRNRIQTRRDNSTFQYFSIDSFVDVNFDNPYSDADVSNVFNVVNFNPVPWLGFQMVSQMPIVEEGFTSVDARVIYMPVPSLQVSLGVSYIDDNPNFQDSNQFNFYTYYRLNDHWGFSIYEQYEAVQNILLYQRYMIHRDLSAWTASIGTQIRNNEGGNTDYGLLFVMTLKDAPQVTLPLAFDAGANAMGPGSSNSN